MLRSAKKQFASEKRPASARCPAWPRAPALLLHAAGPGRHAAGMGHEDVALWVAGWPRVLVWLYGVPMTLNKTPAGGLVPLFPGREGELEQQVGRSLGCWECLRVGGLSRDARNLAWMSQGGWFFVLLELPEAAAWPAVLSSVWSLRPWQPQGDPKQNPVAFRIRPCPTLLAWELQELCIKASYRGCQHHRRALPKQQLSLTPWGGPGAARVGRETPPRHHGTGGERWLRVGLLTYGN